MWLLAFYIGFTEKRTVFVYILIDLVELSTPLLAQGVIIIVFHDSWLEKRGGLRFISFYLAMFRLIVVFVNDISNQTRPACLVGSAQALSGISIEIFIKEDMIFEMRICL